jgi:hypothetical protein
MLLAAAVLFFQFPVLSASNLSISAKASEPAAVSRVADDATPVPSTEAGASSSTKAAAKTEVAFADANSSSMSFAPGRLVAEPITPLNSALSAPVAANADPSPAPTAIEPTPLISSYRPVYGPPVRAVSDRWQKREWLALSIAAHGSAGFDAWTTRKVLSSVPNSQESNPLLRPFAGNASMYAAVQVAPTILDYLSRRMMNSRHDVLRNTWWLPQAVSAVVSVASGVHNLGVYNSR